MTAFAELRRSATTASRAIATFLIRPTPAVPDAGAISRAAMTLWLLAFSFAATALFALLALPLILSTSFGPSETLRTALGQSAISMILAVVILGPLVEEAVFRGWLTGTMRAFAGSALFVAIWFGGSWLLTEYLSRSLSPAILSGLAAAGLLAFVAVDRKDARPEPTAWYRTIFPAIFWAQGLLFGGLHAANVASPSPILPLLMAAPLAICGWLWGYARIALGFGTAWMLHMAYNVPAAVAMLVLMT